MGVLHGQENAVIWGTDVNVVESMERFRQFLLEFTLDGEDESLYKSQLEEIQRTQVREGCSRGCAAYDELRRSSIVGQMMCI